MSTSSWASEKLMLYWLFLQVILVLRILTFPFNHWAKGIKPGPNPNYPLSPSPPPPPPPSKKGYYSITIFQLKYFRYSYSIIPLPAPYHAPYHAWYQNLKQDKWVSPPPPAESHRVPSLYLLRYQLPCGTKFFAVVYFCGLAIFWVLRQLIFAITTDLPFLLGINFCDFQKVPSTQHW